MVGREEVHSLRQRLNAAFDRAAQLHDADIELQSDFAKYLCVLVSGYVETCVAELAIEHCRKRAHPTVSNYASTMLTRSGNLKSERLLQVIGAFDNAWRRELEAFLEGRRKDALDAVVDLKNKIAHGETVTITLSRIREHHVAIQEIVDFIEKKFG